MFCRLVIILTGKKAPNNLSVLIEWGVFISRSICGSINQLSVNSLGVVERASFFSMLGRASAFCRVFCFFPKLFFAQKTNPSDSSLKCLQSFSGSRGFDSTNVPHKCYVKIWQNPKFLQKSCINRKSI